MTQAAVLIDTGSLTTVAGRSAPTDLYQAGVATARPAFECWLNAFYDLVEADDLLLPSSAGRSPPSTGTT